MGRILDKKLYPLDTIVSKDDYLLGTDIDQNLKTVNFNIGSIIRLINSEQNFSGTEFRYSDGQDSEITEASQGFFLTEAGNDDPEATRKIRFNRKNIGGQNLSDLFLLLYNNVYTFSLKVINTSDPADTFYFRVNSAVPHTEYFELDVQIIGEGYNRPLKDLTTYNIFFEVIGDQNNRNVVKNASVEGPITDAKAATAINALANFIIEDDQNVFYQITNGTDSVTYVAEGKGKGSYGTGGVTQLLETDLHPIAGGSGGTLVTVIKPLTYDVDLLLDINNLPTFTISGNTALYFYATPTGSDTTYVYVAQIGAGTYGVGGTAIGAEDIDLISVIGGNVNLVKTVAITGDPSDANVVTAINALPKYTIRENQSVYYKVTPEGTETTYVFVSNGKGAGSYGTGGTTLTAGDIELISVIGGGTAWNLKVGGVQKKAINGGEAVDFKGKKYAVVTYVDGGIVEVSTSKALDDLLATFKPVYKVTKAEHRALIDGGTIDHDALYAIPCRI